MGAVCLLKMLLSTQQTTQCHNHNVIITSIKPEMLCTFEMFPIPPLYLNVSLCIILTCTFIMYSEESGLISFISECTVVLVQYWCYSCKLQYRTEEHKMEIFFSPSRN